MSTLSPRMVHIGSALRLLGLIAIGALCQGTIAEAVNIAPLGSGFLGNNPVLDATYGTTVVHAGTLAVINDGTTTVGSDPGVDTFDPATSNATVSFVGINWGAPRTDTIVSLTLTMETFFDGGWFGPNSSSPGAGLLLTPLFLSDATVQFSVSLDPFSSGTVWTSVPSTSNYLTVMNGHRIGGGGQPNPTVAPAATWNLNTPLTGATAIRLIGPEGGLAATQGGFIGVRELVVEAVPEPSAILALVGGSGLLALRRRRVR